MGHNTLIDLANYALSQGEKLTAIDYTLYGCIAARITRQGDRYSVALRSVEYSPAQILRDNLTYAEMIDYIAGMDKIVIAGLIRSTVDHMMVNVSFLTNALISLL